MQSGITKNPHNAPKLSTDAVSKMTPKEKEDRQQKGRITRLQQLEVPITEALLASQREGVELDGQPKAIVPIADIVVQVIGADDPWILPPEIRASLVEKGGPGSSIFMLRSREILARDLATFRLGPDAEIELPGRNRAEKRAARANLDRHPFKEISRNLSNRLPDGEYYVVVHSMAGASVFKFEYNEAIMQAGLDEERAKKAENTSPEVVAPDPEPSEPPAE